MWRQVIAFACGLVTWVLVASALNRLLRSGMPGYAAAEPVMAFTLSMQCARLALGALASVSAGYVLVRVAPSGHRVPLVLGATLLAMFVPVHYNLWNKFPVWYHLLFLLTIVPLVLAGARIGTRTASVTAR
jgi:hypothetical protein